MERNKIIVFINYLNQLCSVLISCFALKNILQRELAAQSYAAYNGATYFMKSHLKFYSDPSELFFRIVHALKDCEFYISFMKSVQNNIVHNSYATSKYISTHCAGLSS